ncbi:hypothetical protein ABW19_dt0203937 [Dactylella cylindrospora]|nr:hypothetical protein ABW19_dt0203937 [Dactylella cylindrospora]
MPESPSPIQLTDLPREIRDMVYSFHYDECLFSNHSASAATTRRSGKTMSAFDQLNTCVVSIPAHYPEYPLLAIFQVSRQIRLEFLDLLRYKQSVGQGLRYRIKITGRCRMKDPVRASATWEVLPVPPIEPYNQFFDELDVRFHATKYESGIGWAYLRTFRKPGFASYYLFGFLNEFFNHGPQFFYDPILNGSLSSQDPTKRENRCKPKFRKLSFHVYLSHTSVMRDEIQILNMRSANTLSDYGGWCNHRKTDYVMKEGKMLQRGVVPWFKMLNKYGYLDGRVGRVVVLREESKEWTEAWDNLFPIDKRWKDTLKETAAGQLTGFEIEVARDSAPDWEPHPVFQSYGFSWGVQVERTRAKAIETEKTGERPESGILFDDW